MNDFAASDELFPPPAGLELATAGSASPALIAVADHAARHWQAEEQGPLVVGSDAHKQAVCRMFRDTFNPYKPSIIDWPRLSPEARDRLVNLRSGTSRCRPRGRRGCACCPMPTASATLPGKVRSS